jgi:predicted N-acyltransferase
MPSVGWTSRSKLLARDLTSGARIVSDFASIDRLDWDCLNHADNPFLSHAFLGGLETSGSIGPHAGWQPHHLAWYEDGKLAAFAPSYIKTNSHGEFVFDWAWADAYNRHRLPYYPKLLTAVPYSPVSGPRLLTRQGHPGAENLRQQLIGLALEECERQGLSSWHCNFVSGDDHQALAKSTLLRRSDWQFHWRNNGYSSFDDFLGRLRSRKRKNIRRERRQVAEAGICFDWKTGAEINEEDVAFIHRCYTHTFHAYGNHPALTEEFFGHLAHGLKERFLVSFASRNGERLAMSLFLSGGGRLYGRYWGCVREFPGLHFEAAYYQGIEHCIKNGIDVFESGAQGEHKVSRGFLPSKTRSYHFVGNDAFREAIATFLAREMDWLDSYRDELLKHNPYRQDAQ